MYARAAFKFELADIPAYSQIKSAKFSYYVAKKSSGEINYKKSLHEMDKAKAWDESYLHDSYRPVVTKEYYTDTVRHIDPPGKVIALNDSGPSDRWEEFDVTSYVQDVIVQKDSNNGFLLKFQPADTIVFPYPIIPLFKSYIVSSEHSDIDKRPKLEITYSDEQFVEVIYPNGGDSLKNRKYYVIEWVSNSNDNVTIELIENSTVVSVIADNISNSGYYKWSPPLDLSSGDAYKIRIKRVSDNTVLDESDSVFTFSGNTIVSNFPYVQDFDTFPVFGQTLKDDWRPEFEQILEDNWVQEPDVDDCNWNVHKNKTPHKNGKWNETGPSYDHTTRQGHYLYIEASGYNYPEKRADLYTPYFDLKDMQSGTLSFWYHMYAKAEDAWTKHMGELYVDVNVDGVWQNDFFHTQYSKGDRWILSEQDISEFSGSLVRFRFRAITGNDWQSDIAIDDFRIDITATNVTSDTAEFKDSKVSLHDGLLKIHNNNTPIGVSIVNLAGRVIKKYQINTDKEIKFNTLSSGIYLLKLEAEGYRKSLKLCIK